MGSKVENLRQGKEGHSLQQGHALEETPENDQPEKAQLQGLKPYSATLTPDNQLKEQTAPAAQHVAMNLIW